MPYELDHLHNEEYVHCIDLAHGYFDEGYSGIPQNQNPGLRLVSYSVSAYACSQR